MSVEMARLEEKVRLRLVGEMLTASPVQPAGATATMLVAVGALLGLTAVRAGLIGILAALLIAGIHQRVQRRASGLRLTPYMVLAVTHDRIHLFKAGPRWSSKDELASWDRSGVVPKVGERILTLGLSLEVRADGRHVRLEAVRGRRARELAETLRTGVPPRPDIAADTI